MKRVIQPLNISLLNPKAENLRLALPVTSLDTLDGPGGNFHEEGLFSTRIFGRVGDPARDRTFGYINLNLPVFHPIIFRTIVRLKSFYAGILAGNQYAKFDPNTKEFVKSNELEGATGFHFFLSHWAELEFTPGESDIRNLQIDLIRKFRDVCLIDKMLVMPAGLRDAEVDSNGRITVGEINEYYQGVLMLTRNLPERVGRNDDLRVYDRTRYALQTRFCQIYDYIENMLTGKQGFIQSRWASRRVFNGTRNVITSLDISTADLDLPNRPKFNDAVVGLYQAAVSVTPKAIYALRTKILDRVFNTGSNRVELVNKDTLRREWVEVSNEDLDRWSTEEGLEQVIGELAVIDKRSRPVEIAGHYLALNYLDDRGHFKVFYGIEDLPEGFDPKFVRPLTYFELIYIAGLEIWNTTAAFVTRYPVENVFSSIPAKTYLKTTVKGELRYGLDDQWQEDRSQVATEYPILQVGIPAQYCDSLSVNPTRLSSLDADFDGDTSSYNAVYSDDAIAEANAYFKKRKAYIQAAGGLAFDTGIHTLNLTLRFITGEPKERPLKNLRT